MKTFAVLNDKMVSNVIVANTKEDAEFATNLTCVEYTEENPAMIGWIYDEQNNKFISSEVDNGTLG